MKEFIFKQGTGLWPQGETIWHVYVLPDLAQDTALHELVCGCQAALADWPMTMVEPELLHITMAQISDAQGASTSREEIDELIAALRESLATVDPFTVTVGSCLSYESGAIFDLHPDGQLNQLRDTIAATIAQVRGPASIEYDTGVLHLTLAYANADADSDAAQRRLRRVRPSHAPMTIGSVWVLEVAADPDAKTITWTAPNPGQQIFLGTQAS